MAKTILQVDDERKIVTVLKGHLEQAGFRVVTTGDGRELSTTDADRRDDRFQAGSGHVVTFHGSRITSSRVWSTVR